MRLRNLLALGLCLAATACQPPTYRILAHQERYRLIFSARGSGAWPFRTDEGIAATRLTVRNRDRYVWAIERDHEQAGCDGPAATPPFPVAYGSLVPCYRTLIAPQPIGRDTLYRVQGEGNRLGSGFFRYEPFMGGGRATNLEWEEAEAQVRRWPSLPDPDGASQTRSKASAAPAAAAMNAVSASNP